MEQVKLSRFGRSAHRHDDPLPLRMEVKIINMLFRFQIGREDCAVDMTIV